MKTTYRPAGYGDPTAASAPVCPAAAFSTAASWQDVPLAGEAANRMQPRTSTRKPLDQ
jgi:hypothetical protein